MVLCEWDAQKETMDKAAYTCLLVSYRRLSAQFQFSLSADTLGYLSQCSEHRRMFTAPFVWYSTVQKKGKLFRFNDYDFTERLILIASLLLKIYFIGTEKRGVERGVLFEPPIVFRSKKAFVF
jgi:hypothetical protein